MLKSWRRRLEQCLRKHDQHVPNALKDRVYRRRMRLDLSPPADLVIKVARSKDEHAGASRLLHDAYVDAGYMARHSSGMRLSNYHLIPGHRVLIAVQRGEIVGTLTLIPDSPLGLPMDAAYDLTAVRAVGGIAEISALAIKRGYRGHPARLMFPMVKYFFHYAERQLGLVGLIFCVQPRHFSFYRALLHAQPLRNGYLKEYGFVGGAPAQAGFINIAASLRWGKKQYAGTRPEKNFYDYMVHRQLIHLESPAGDDGLDASLKAEELRELLAESGK